MCLSQFEVAQALGVLDSVVDHLEKGYMCKGRKSINIIWGLSIQWDLSLNWLLNGLGKPYDPDPLELMPETLLVQRGAGIRRDFTRKQAAEGEFTDHILEFVMAVDKFKSKNQVPFPSLTQLYEIITALGYRKSVPARIAPLGYIIEHQQWAEKLKHINEKVEASLDRRDKDLRPEETKSAKRLLPSKIRYSIKMREKRRAAIQNDNTLSEAEKQRRQRIGQRTRIRGKKFILIDSEGREYAVENLPKFCKEHQITPGHLYEVASGHRKQHKGWRARVVPGSGSTSITTVQEKPAVDILERIKLGLS